MYVLEGSKTENIQLVEASSDDDDSQCCIIQMGEPIVISDDEQSEMETEIDIGRGTGSRENPIIFEHSDDCEDYIINNSYYDEGDYSVYLSTLSDGVEAVFMDSDSGDVFMGCSSNIDEVEMDN